jgi:uncharacterized membrane protein (DUF2068 family)
VAQSRKDARPARVNWLRVIALGKLGKVVLMLIAAYGVLRLHDASVLERLYQWAAGLPEGIEHKVVKRALEWASGLSPRRINALGFVTLTYAAVFTLEGVGLWLGKRWAEWLTTLLTASLIPLEVWEFCHRPQIGTLVVVAVNVAIVWYLINVLRHRVRPPM